MSCFNLIKKVFNQVNPILVVESLDKTDLSIKMGKSEVSVKL